MPAARDFRDLRVYQSAIEGADDIYALSRSFPKEERYSLTDQVRRSSRSVCANIAEAWRKRRYEAAFVSKLSDADAEAAETSVWLDFAFRYNFINEADHAKLTERYNHIQAQFHSMMRDASKWCHDRSR